VEWHLVQVRERFDVADVAHAELQNRCLLLSLVM
jgi:hypothetical protein